MANENTQNATSVTKTDISGLRGLVEGNARLSRLTGHSAIKHHSGLDLILRGIATQAIDRAKSTRALCALGGTSILAFAGRTASHKKNIAKRTHFHRRLKVR